MESVKRAAEVLRQAEASLREIASQAVAAGDYAGVVQVAAWAQTVGELVKKAPADGAVTNRTAPPHPNESRPTTVRDAAAAKKKGARPSKGDYPRFFRHGEQLVRIAWSKKEKKEYQHKAPFAVLQRLAEAMAEAGKDGRIFSTEDVLPIRDGDGSEVPSYQAYVGIALLKQTALIDQHGRQGYSIPRMKEFKDSVETVWRKLPEH